MSLQLNQMHSHSPYAAQDVCGEQAHEHEQVCVEQPCLQQPHMKRRLFQVMLAPRGRVASRLLCHGTAGVYIHLCIGVYIHLCI